MFSGTVGEVIDVIEGPMSSTADSARSTGPSVPWEALKGIKATCFKICDFSNMSPVKYVIVSTGLQETKENRERIIEIDSGNMFAKKINLRDNFYSFNEFPNKNKNFIDIKEDVGTRLMSAEEVKRYGHV